MPTYNYICTNVLCKEEIEVVQKINDDELIFCPACQGKTLKKIIISTGGFILKGKGWYKTDYKNK